MEYVCTAYESEAADKKVIKDLYGTDFMRHYRFFKIYIDVVREGERPYKGIWSPIERVIHKEWIGGNTKSNQALNRQDP